MSKINRFMGPVQTQYQQRYVDQFVPLPFELMQKKVDNVFKWYTLEEYNNDNRVVDGESMKELPVGFALGALSFFLGTASLLSTNSQTYSNQNLTKGMNKKVRKQILEAMRHFGDGLARYIHSPKQIYSVSQEKLVSLN